MMAWAGRYQIIAVAADVWWLIPSKHQVFRHQLVRYPGKYHMIWTSKSHFRSNPRVPAWEYFGRTFELPRDPQESSQRPQESTRRPTEESQEPTSASSRPALPSSNKKVNQLKIDTMKSSENVKGWFGIRQTCSIDLDRFQNLIIDLWFVDMFMFFSEN